jgi:methylated-DNA-[protein]-cysteine S-methyltransferase
MGATDSFRDISLFCLSGIFLRGILASSDRMAARNRASQSCIFRWLMRADSYHLFETAAGYCAIAWNDAGIVRLQLPATDAAATERYLRRRLPGAEPAIPTPPVAEAITAVQRYFTGQKVDFSAIRVDLGQQDGFFMRVYAEARRIGWGMTSTYGTLAKQLGAEPQAARDVGQAMARNPVPLIIPCHRVLAAGGKVGGFSAPGGSAAKIRMLELEGVRLGPPPAVQASLEL